MSFLKISDLPAATSAGATDQLETNQGGTSRRLTVAQVATYVSGNLASPTISGSTVVSANTSTDALRITQTGTGNALVVEDSANPDATPFVVTADGNVGVGTSAPGEKLNVVGRIRISGINATNGDAGIDFVDSSNTGGYTLRWLDSGGYVANLTQLSSANATAAGVMLANNGGGYRWSTNGAERMRLTGSGSLGLGTSSPEERLDVRGGRMKVGGLSVNGRYLARNVADIDVLDFGIATGTGVGDSIGLYNLTSTGLITFGTNNAERVRIDASGNVGIGTSSPGARLNVVGADGVTNSRFAGASFAVRIVSAPSVGAVIEATNNTEATYQPLLVGGSQVQFTTFGAERMRLTGSGSLGLGTSSPEERLDVRGGRMKVGGLSVNGKYLARNVADIDVLDFGIGTGTGFGDSVGLYNLTSTGLITFGTNSAERMRIDSSGNVGIGTTPSTRLDVSGSITTRSTVPEIVYVETDTGTTLRTLVDGSSWDLRRNDYTSLLSIQNATGNTLLCPIVGNVGIGTAGPAHRLDVVGGYIRQQTQSNSLTGNHTLFYTNSSSSADFGTYIDHVDNGVVDTRVTIGGGTPGTRGIISFGTAASGGSTERARITAGGEFLVGTSAATGVVSARRDVSGGQIGYSFLNNDQLFTVENFYQFGVAQYTVISSTNNAYTAYQPMYIRASALYHQNGAGTHLFATTGGNTSDRRIKEDLIPISGALAKVCSLTGYTFRFSADYVAKTPDDTFKGNQIGVVAQEVEAVFPEIVHGSDDMKTVSYEKLVAPLIEAVKELTAKLGAAEARIATLETR